MVGWIDERGGLMPFVEDTKVKGGIFILYGMWGVGKTMMLAAFAQVVEEITGKKTMMADWERGRSVIPPGIPIVPWVPETEKMNEVLKKMEPVDPMDQMQVQVSDFKAGDFGALGVDTLGSMMDLVMRSIVQKDRSEDKRTKRTRVRTIGGRTIIQPDEADYGFAIFNFEEFLVPLWGEVDKGKFILLLAHDKLGEKRDEMDNIVEQIGGPEIVGFKLTKTAPKIATMTLRMRVVRDMTKNPHEVYRVLDSDTNGLYFAKDRTTTLPRTLKIEVPQLEGRSAEEHKKEILKKYAAVWRRVFKGIGAIKEGEGDGK